MKPIAEALKEYDTLINELARRVDRHFGAIGDPHFEGFRFYTIDKLSGSFNYEEVIELAGETVDKIEGYLMQAEGLCTLLFPILTKLKSVAPAFNANGKTVFLGSWGMGPCEIGWMIRRINDRESFERYLQSSGISEEAVDACNEACERDFFQAEQATSSV